MKDEVFEKIIKAESSSLEKTVKELIDFQYGWAGRNLQLPLVWDTNILIVNNPQAPTGEILRTTEDVFNPGVLQHKKIIVYNKDERASKNLLQKLKKKDPSWTITSNTYMQLTEEAKKPSSGAGYETEGKEVVEARKEMAEEIAKDYFTKDTVLQLIEHEDLIAEKLRCRWFAAGSPPESFCNLFYHENGVGQIDNVGTSVNARNQGLASEVVLAASAESRKSGNTLTYLATSSDDWPQHLYKKLGFSPVGKIFSATVYPEK